MARTNKTGIDCFPKCNPHWITLSRPGCSNDKIRYNAYRNISSGFVARKDIRNIVLKKYNNRCAYCGSIDDLQIDHIVSVYNAFKTRMSIDVLNSEDNLQVLCRSCNAAKTP
jgi:5-methylcytosine-specific restriction endonuclease McrA